MSWLGKLFGTEKAVDSVIGEKGLVAKAGGWFDRLHYTDEEQAENRQITREWVVDYLKALEPFKVMQRYLMMVVSSVWAVLVVQVCVAIWLGRDDTLKLLIDFCASPFVWAPAAAGFTLYLGGGTGLPYIGKK